MSHENFVYFVEGKRREIAIPSHPFACLNFPVYIHALVRLILYVLQLLQSQYKLKTDKNINDPKAIYFRATKCGNFNK